MGTKYKVLSAKIIRLGQNQKIITVPANEPDYNIGDYVKIQRVEEIS